MPIFVRLRGALLSTLEFCSHVWSSGPQSGLDLLDRIQRGAIRLIDDASLTSDLASLDHRRAVSCLSLFYRYYHGFCSDELASVTRPRLFVRGSDYSNLYLVTNPRCRTGLSKKSLFCKTARLWF